MRMDFSNIQNGTDLGVPHSPPHPPIPPVRPFRDALEKALEAMAGNGTTGVDYK